MSTQRFNARDLGVVVGRTTTVPSTVGGLVSALRDSVRNWVGLASAKRSDGGRITAVARDVARFASVLTDTHGADVGAVRDSVVSRSILTDSDAVVIASYFPYRFEVDADGELVDITGHPVDADADADADTDA